MHLVKVGVAALNQTPLDWRGNSDRIIEAIDQARAQQVQMLGLPELTLSGYGCEDAFFAPDTMHSSIQALLRLIPHSKGIITNVGLPIRHQGALFNCSAILCDGKLVGLVPKKILAGDGVHYEHRWFKEWPMGHSDYYHIPGELNQGHELRVPMGDLIFEWKGLRFGYEICEEAWTARRPGARLAEQSVDIIFNPSASHFSFGKNEIRKRFVLEGSRAFSCVYIYSNLVGNESGRLIFDGSLFIASQGELMAEAKRFSFHDVYLLTSVLDLEVNRTNRAQTASFRPALEMDTLKRELVTSATIPSCPTDALPQKKLGVSQLSPKNEEFLWATSLGLFDYLRKSHNQGFAVSLSGGVDSSVVAVLCASAFQLAKHDLGLQGLKQKLSYIQNIQSCTNLEELLEKVIHCVYQSSQNSSEQTLEAARSLAQALNIAFSEWTIEPMKSLYENVIEQSLHRTLSWQTDDLALQNIQARVRAPGIWLLANLKNFLLLATSNRSEAAVGYATMDGDTAGGLSPIAGVDKAFLCQWIRWRASHSCGPLQEIPELQRVFQVPPTAELRPKQFQQTDENDLMPYIVLDFIERHLLIDRLSPRDIWSLATTEFPQYSRLQLRNWVVRFLRLWRQNQWKRERFAPSFHLDAESLDPKTWCRFPILSKAFEQDIEALDAIKE